METSKIYIWSGFCNMLNIRHTALIKVTSVIIEGVWIILYIL